MLSAGALAWQERGTREEVGDHELFVVSRGAEAPGPAVCLLHGFPSCSIDWQPLLDLVPETAHPLLAFDFLGFGLSDKPRDGDYSLVGQADRVEELMHRHFPGRPVVLVAHDMGTSVANELMARDIDGSGRLELRSVLLLNGSMVQSAASPTLGQRLLRGPLGPVAARLTYEGFFRRQFGSIFSPAHPLTSEQADDQWSLLCERGGNRIGDRLISYMDERERLAARWHGAIADWSGPLRLAWGMLDPVATPKVLESVLALRPEAPVDRYPDLGHYPQIEDPGRIGALLPTAVGASL